MSGTHTHTLSLLCLLPSVNCVKLLGPVRVHLTEPALPAFPKWSPMVVRFCLFKNISLDAVLVHLPDNCNITDDAQRSIKAPQLPKSL